MIHKAQDLLLGGERLPIDLIVKSGICAAHMGDMLESDKILINLLNEAPGDYLDLYMETGETFLVLCLLENCSDLHVWIP